MKPEFLTILDIVQLSQTCQVVWEVDKVEAEIIKRYPEVKGFIGLEIIFATDIIAGVDSMVESSPGSEREALIHNCKNPQVLADFLLPVFLNESLPNIVKTINKAKEGMEKEEMSPTHEPITKTIH